MPKNHFRVVELGLQVSQGELIVKGKKCNSDSIFDVQAKCGQNTARLISPLSDGDQIKQLKQDLIKALSALEKMS